MPIQVSDAVLGVGALYTDSSPSTPYHLRIQVIMLPTNNIFLTENPQIWGPKLLCKIKRKLESPFFPQYASEWVGITSCTACISMGRRTTTIGTSSECLFDGYIPKFPQKSWNQGAKWVRLLPIFILGQWSQWDMLACEVPQDVPFAFARTLM